MRRVVFDGFGGPDVLHVVEAPAPHPGRGQVRIAVRAAGVSPTDAKARAGLHGGEPGTTGRDVAGVVDEVGEGVTGVSVGDRVFGVTDEADAAAEYALATHVAVVPSELSFAQAATLPVVLETATRALDRLGVARGTTLLVNGASGGIGGAAVQLARARGARVIGVAGPSSQDRLRDLGAVPVVYGDDLVARVRAVWPEPIDRALDVAGNGVLPELVALTGDPDRVVTIADFPGARATGVHFSTGEDGRAFGALDGIGALVASRAFTVPAVVTFPFDRAADAHRLVEGGAGGRKVALVP